LALTRQTEESLTLLRTAVHSGVNADEADELEKGDDWKSLRRQPGFEALVAEARKRVASSAAKPN
jgi:hypothetical protein